MNFNKLLLIGQIVGEIQEKSFKDGEKKFLIIPLKIEETDRDGHIKASVFTIEVFGKAVDFCQKYVKSGDYVYMEGALKLHVWKRQDGTETSSLKVNIWMVSKINPREENKNEGHEFF